MRVLVFLFLSLVIIAADQASKWYVMEHILRPQLEQAEPPLVAPQFVEWYQIPTETLGSVEMTILPNFNLVSVWNKGVSFGMLKQTSDNGPLILIGLSAAISLIFLVWLFRTDDRIQSIGIAMVIGGALGNVIDRLRFGAVFDFLDFHAFDYHWPAFNIADSGIVLGVALLILHSFLLEKRLKDTA